MSERGGGAGEERIEGREKGGNKKEMQIFIVHTVYFGLSAVLIIVDADICQFLYLASHAHNSG